VLYAESKEAGILDGQRMKKKKRKGDGPKARDKEVPPITRLYVYMYIYICMYVYTCININMCINIFITIIIIIIIIIYITTILMMLR
jgi:hypothetical protein